MPDISMCSGIGCKLRFGCYRFKAIPNEPYQSYFPELPVENKGDISTCGYFWPTDEFKATMNDREVDRKELE